LAGDLHQMQQTTRHFLTFAVENKNVNAIVGANWVSGLLQYERNNLGAASSHFSDVIQRRYRSNFAAAFSSVLGLARIFQVQGELGKAQELIDSLRTETLRLNNTNSLPALDSIQANQWLLSGNVDSALRWARGFHSGELEEPVVWFEVPSLTRARILLSYGTASDLQALRHDLEEVQAAAKARHFTQRMIQTLAHLALAYDRLRRTDDALEALQQALKLAQPGRFIRSFIDVGPALRPLLRRLSRLGVASPDYLTQILAAFDTVPQAESPPSTMSAPPEAGTIDLLTSREEEILRLMQDGLTNQEIADELIISLYTVKRHATNIYTKLGVNNRRQAIRKSKQLGILPTN
jgi:LuxR family maltose regulon positive regulatory protein